MLPKFYKPEDFEKYLKENHYFVGNEYLNIFHAWMGVIMQWSENSLWLDFDYFKDFFNRFFPENEKEKDFFILALYEAMRLWAYELRKARDLKFALRKFIDNKSIYRHKLGEHRFFYDFFDNEKI